MDWQQVIDEAIEAPPTPAPLPQQRVLAGRRALLRRRVAASVSAAALAAVAVVGTTQVLPSRSADVVEPAAQVPGGAEPGDLDVPVDPAVGSTVAFDASGRLVRGLGVEVTGRYDHVWQSAYPEISLVEYRFDDEVRWALVHWTGSTTGAAGGATDSPADPDRTFDEWVADAVETPGRAFSYRDDELP